jgi:general secretion pathway protein F
LTDAIAQAQDLAFSPQLNAALGQARLAITEGKRMSAAFAAQGIGDSVTERLLQLASAPETSRR